MDTDCLQDFYTISQFVTVSIDHDRQTQKQKHSYPPNTAFNRHWTSIYNFHWQVIGRDYNLFFSTTALKEREQSHVT